MFYAPFLFLSAFHNDSLMNHETFAPAFILQSVLSFLIFFILVTGFHFFILFIFVIHFILFILFIPAIFYLHPLSELDFVNFLLLSIKSLDNYSIQD